MWCCPFPFRTDCLDGGNSTERRSVIPITTVGTKCAHMTTGYYGGGARAHLNEPLHRHDIIFNCHHLREPVVVRLVIPHLHLVSHSNGFVFVTIASRGPAFTRGILCHGRRVFLGTQNSPVLLWGIFLGGKFWRRYGGKQVEKKNSTFDPRLYFYYCGLCNRHTLPSNV